MGWSPAHPLPQQVRVVRDWPGGPPLGQVLDAVPATRREYLLRLGVVEPVAPTDAQTTRTPAKRGSVRHPEQAETDLLEQRSTRA